MIRRALASLFCPDLFDRGFSGVWEEERAGQDKRPASSLAVCGWFIAVFPYGTRPAVPYPILAMPFLSMAYGQAPRP